VIIVSLAGGRDRFCNDAGFYVLDADVRASKLREIETPDERGKILAAYREHCRELSRGRLDIPRRAPPYSAHDLWDSNMPGSTLFMPVCDVTRALISLIAQFVDHQLRLGDGWLEYRRRPPRLLFRGYRAMVEERLSRTQTDDATVAPRATGLLLHLQRAQRHLPKHAACNRGLGSRRMETLRISLARGATANWLPDCCIWPSVGNPIGLDGVIEACCPPFYASMDAAVYSVLVPSLRGEASSDVVPHRIPAAEHRAGVISVSDEGLACTKAICNYIFETYGRFPAGTDAIHLMWFVQAHYIDTDYYDRFFNRGA
jgi:hypothetical protein